MRPGNRLRLFIIYFVIWLTIGQVGIIHCINYSRRGELYTIWSTRTTTKCTYFPFTIEHYNKIKYIKQ